MPIADGTMVKGIGPVVYLIEGGRRRWVTTPAEVERLGGWQRVQNVSEDEINAHLVGAPIGTPQDGIILMGATAEVYLIQGGRRCWITTPAELDRLGGWRQVTRIDHEVLHSLPSGGPVGNLPDGTLIKGDGPEVFKIEGGNRRWVPDWQTLGALGGWNRVMVVLQESVDSLPKGQDLPSAAPAPAPAPAPPTTPLEAEKTDDLGNKKQMKTEATLYRDGTLMASTRSISKHWAEGIRGGVMYVVLVDDQGRNHWVSDKFVCTTVGSTWDPTTPSDRTDNFSQGNIPASVAQATHRLDIYHAMGPLEDPVAKLKTQIKQVKDVYDFIKPLLSQL